MRALCLGEAAPFWATDAAAAASLRTPFYANAFAIGAGHLGEGLARRHRAVWDLSKQRLGTRGWRAPTRTRTLARALTVARALTLTSARVAGARCSG